MAYNYAYPQKLIDEEEVIRYATDNDYYLADRPPFTSPENMVKIAHYYADHIETGSVTNPDQGLALLNRNLRDGHPVIIDVLSDFSDPQSEAHFIVITGISAGQPNNTTVIFYNDPFTGTEESAVWNDNVGIWPAWQTNGDPGGAGWWLIIPGTK